MVFEDLPTLRERMLLDHLVDSLVLHTDDTQDACGGKRMAAFTPVLSQDGSASTADLDKSVIFY